MNMDRLLWQRAPLGRFGRAVEPRVRPRIATRLKLFHRRAFEIACAMAGLLLLAPLLAAVALAIKIDSGGPIFYTHLRVGKGLRTFRLLKFRSMYADCAGGSPLTSLGDARVTRVGRFLRRYKLDELPQLVNVLKGEMQLVGVRPQVQKFVDFYPFEYAQLLQAPPGITDPASLIFRNEAMFFYEGSIENQYVTRIMPIKLEISLRYAMSRTFVSDLEILFRTVLGLPAPSSIWERASFISKGQTFPEFGPKNIS
jgi:lipopolysaccharide/colanic/teichoic acid biosynthesis glycosyltransferase